MSNGPTLNRHKSSDTFNREIVASFDELRRRFQAFINDDFQFRKFIKECNETPSQRRRLRFWQQDLWDLFIKEHAEFAELNFTEIRSAFYLCHVHLKPLRQVEIPIQKGLWCITYSPEGGEVISENTPYSIPFALDSSAWSDATHITVDHCDECVAWRAQHGL